jgi:hypothetical protein
MPPDEGPETPASGEAAAVTIPVPSPSMFTSTPQAIATPAINRFVLRVRLLGQPLQNHNPTTATQHPPAAMLSKLYSIGAFRSAVLSPERLGAGVLGDRFSTASHSGAEMPELVRQK